MAKAATLRSAPAIEVAMLRSGRVLQRSKNRFDSPMASEEPGDAVVLGAIGPAGAFQSTPGSEEPGDGAGPDARAPDSRFNPRPAPRSRATGFQLQNHAHSKFQSTPGSEEPGDQCCQPATRGQWLFQSTPGSEEPGDCC